MQCLFKYSIDNDNIEQWFLNCCFANASHPIYFAAYRLIYLIHFK